jgi:hypothetical protein
VLSSFAAPTATSGDVECDDVTFGTADALWIRDTATAHLRAVQIASGSCAYGGGVSIDVTKAWVNGGGTVEQAQIFTGRVAPNGPLTVHVGFMLHCFSIASPSTIFGMVRPNTMNITWGAGNGFHVEQVLDNGNTNDVCDFDNFLAAAPPGTTFNRIHGQGTGRFHYVDETGRHSGTGHAEWTISDHGEPGTFDEVGVAVYQDGDPQPLVITSGVCGCLNGNVQAHQVPQA